MSLHNWLLTAGFSEAESSSYSVLLERHSVTTSQLLFLTHDLLREIGIDKVGHRIKLLEHAKSTQGSVKENSPQQTPGILGKIEESAKYLLTTFNRKPKLGVVLGTNLSTVVDLLQNAKSINFTDVPNFPKTTASGHSGVITVGDLHGHCVVALKGRSHYYESGNSAEIIFALQVLKVWGVTKVILVSACGSLNKSIEPGDIVFIDNHINMIPNPLIGPNINELGPRWPHGKDPYCLQTNTLAMKVAKINNIKAHRGVYIGITGPSGSTRAELRAWRQLGADVLGYSTTPEVISCLHLKMAVVGIGVVIDSVVHDEAYEVADEECFRIAALTSPTVALVIDGIAKDFIEMEFITNGKSTPTLVFEGNTFYHKQQYKEALDCYKQALRQEKEVHAVFNIRNRLCATYTKLRDFDNAFAQSNEMVNIKPNHYKSYIRRGGYYFYQKNYGLALQDYNLSLLLLEHKQHQKSSKSEEGQGEGEGGVVGEYPTDKSQKIRKQILAYIEKTEEKLKEKTS